jgi:hypothetical protein
MDKCRRIHYITSTLARFESSGFLLVETPKNPLCMQHLLTTKRHLTVTLWMAVRENVTTPASLSEGDGP